MLFNSLVNIKRIKYLFYILGAASMPFFPFYLAACLRFYLFRAFLQSFVSRRLFYFLVNRRN